MKKILFVFILFSIMTNVRALTYSEIPCMDSLNAVIERRYLWYQEKENVAYFRKGEGPPSFTMHEGDKKYSKFTEWDTLMPEKREERNIDVRTIYAYQDRKPAVYFIISGFSVVPLYINEIHIYQNGKPIVIQGECTGCSDNFMEKVTDDIYEPNAFVMEDSVIRLTLPETSDVLQLEVNMHSEQVGTKKWNVKATYDKAGKEIASQLFFEQDMVNVPSENFAFACDINAMDEMYPKYTDVEYSMTPVEPIWGRRIEEVQEYRYQDMLYKYSEKKRTYTGEYLKEAPGSIYSKDASKYKDFYACTAKEIWKGKLLLEPIKKQDLKEAKKRETAFSSPVISKNNSGEINLTGKGKAPIKKINMKIYFYFVYLFFLLLLLYFLYKKYHSKKIF